MFNCKEKSVLLSLNTILESIKLDSTNEDPSETIWYIANDESIIMMVHPRYGLVFYNDEMHIVGMFERNDMEGIEDLLNDFDIHEESHYWHEIGIDQVDYSPV